MDNSMEQDCAGDVIMSSNGSPFQSDVPDTSEDGLPEDRKERHKLVERKRREKTRILVQQLQQVLPNVTDRTDNPKIHVILENTLEYLQSLGDECQNSSMADTSVSVAAKSLTTSRTAANPLDDCMGLRFNLAFHHAPVGVVISEINGTFICTNQFFQHFFRFQQETIGSSMFTLTSRDDLAKTLKAASMLLTGQAPRLVFTKRCVRADGEVTEPLLVEMSCVWKDSKPHCFICYVKPAEISTPPADPQFVIQLASPDLSDEHDLVEESSSLAS